MNKEGIRDLFNEIMENWAELDNELCIEMDGECEHNDNRRKGMVNEWKDRLEKLLICV